MSFDAAIEYVIRNEGGYVNDPDDPGGETKYGISKARYPALDIKSLTKEQAKNIYWNDYWIENNLNQVADPAKATAILDTVVNHGKGGALVQQSLNNMGYSLAVDNRIGPQTISAINTSNAKLFIAELSRVRKEYIQSLSGLEKFKKGLFTRAERMTELISKGLPALAVIAGAGAIGYWLWKRSAKSGKSLSQY